MVRREQTKAQTRKRREMDFAFVFNIHPRLDTPLTHSSPLPASPSPKDLLTA